MSHNISDLVTRLMASDPSCQALGLEATERLVKMVAGQTQNLPDEYLLNTAAAANLVGLNLIDFFMFCERYKIEPIEWSAGSEYYFAGDILMARSHLYQERKTSNAPESSSNVSKIHPEGNT